jgi:hypothetical protein
LRSIELDQSYIEVERRISRRTYSRIRQKVMTKIVARAQGTVRLGGLVRLGVLF